MSSWQASLRKILIDDLDVLAALNCAFGHQVGARIGPEVPQRPTFPCVTIGSAGTEQDGVVDFSKSFAQVTVWDTDYTRCQETAMTIRYALQRYRGRVEGIRIEGITFVNEVDIKDPETGRWTRPADYRLNYWEE